jgi:PAS domain S-box-containing protein
LLAGLVVASGRRFAVAAEQLSDQQDQLEDQAVELEQQVQELEVSNTELAESMDLERQAREQLEAESRERRRNASLLEAALQSAPVAMSLLDENLRYQIVNETTCRVTGHPPSYLIGKTLREVNPAFGHDTEQALRQVLATLEPLRNMEMQRPGNAPGKARRMLISAHPARLPDDSIGLGVTAVDITEQRELLEQFHHAQKLEAVGRLAAGIAHDFNNLLTVIRSYCDLALLEMPDEAAGRNEIREIRAAGERAAALSRQMVALSRKQAIIPRALAVGEAVREMESMLHRVTGDTVNLRVELDAPLGIVHIDPTHLEQVLMNLVINAVDAMPTGGEITVTGSNVRLDEAAAAQLHGLRAGDHVAITVRDTGTGIDPETLRQVFDPFFTTKAPGKGTGLGLSTVYGIVRDAGGHVHVDSVVGRGTSFTVYLPAEVADDAAPVRRDLAPEPAARAVGDEVVLVVEDEDSLRSTLARLLARRGYTVLEAAHGGEALRVSVEHQGKIDLVLSDFHMPGMHGRDLIDRLHEQRPELKVVFMSGSSAGPEHGEDRDAGPHPFIPKPFTVEELARTVRRALDA